MSEIHRRTQDCPTRKRGLKTPRKARILYSMSEHELLSRITVSPDICHGKPCIRGLRYPVEFVLELLSSGMTEKEILADYEDLEPADLQAVYAWAARLARTKRSEPIAV